MTPVTAGKRGAVKRRWTAVDNQMKPAKEEEDGTKTVCKQCSNAMCKNDPYKLARHSSTHLTFRPWKCSVCNETTSRKGNLQRHLQRLHQGNGEVMDNRTTEYFDALEAMAIANFPEHGSAITIYFGDQKKALRIQDGSDEEDDNPPIVHLPASDHESLDIRENVQTMPEVVRGTSVIKQEMMSNELPPPSIEKRADRTLPDIRREIMQEPLEPNMRNGEGERIEDPFDQHLAVDVETDTVEKKPSVRIPPRSPIHHTTSIVSHHAPNLADVQSASEPVPNIHNDNGVEKTTMLDFAEINAGIEKTKLDLSRVRAKMTFLENLSETRDAENHRLKHEIEARDAEHDRLKQDIEARDAENSRLKSEKDQLALQIRLLQHEIAGLKRELGLG